MPALPVTRQCRHFYCYVVLVNFDLEFQMPRIAQFALLIAAASVITPATAADWAPTKPVRLIVGFPPGGATDLVGRILQPKLSAALGKQLVIDNRPGANGLI